MALEWPIRGGGTDQRQGLGPGKHPWVLTERVPETPLLHALPLPPLLQPLFQPRQEWALQGLIQLSNILVLPTTHLRPPELHLSPEASSLGGDGPCKGSLGGLPIHIFG